MKIIIKEKIKKSTKTIKQISDEIYITERVIYEWMRGRKIPTLENAYALAKSIGCKIDDLITEL